MNITEQLNLLRNIKESLKNKLLEIGAKINDETPFSEYAEFIKNAEKTVFKDSCLGSFHRKDKTLILCTDNYNISTHRKDKTLITAFDNSLGSSHTKDNSVLSITDSYECYRVIQNPAMTENSMDGWTASANHYTNNEQPYKGFNKNMAAENCWWTGGSPSFPCWLALSFDTLYKIRSVEIINENASPENFKNALIQFRTSDEAEWETLYEIVNRSNITAYSEEYKISSNKYFKEFRLYITASHSSTVSIQNININFKE